MINNIIANIPEELMESITDIFVTNDGDEMSSTGTRVNGYPLVHVVEEGSVYAFDGKEWSIIGNDIEVAYYLDEMPMDKWDETRWCFIHATGRRVYGPYGWYDEYEE